MKKLHDFKFNGSALASYQRVIRDRIVTVISSKTMGDNCMANDKRTGKKQAVRFQDGVSASRLPH